ncbi:hypothetical protein Ddc_13777 [Ditylenchus destructor]|nr:hypothetical protein Ddc_13777 [Ditylenchus destructor]
MVNDPANGAASPDTAALDLMQNLTLQSPSSSQAPTSPHPMLSDDEDDIIEVRSPGSIAASFLDSDSLLDGEQPRRVLTEEEKLLEERRIAILLDDDTSPAAYYKFMENLPAPSTSANDLELQMDRERPESEDSVQDLELEESNEVVEEAEKKDEEAKVGSDKALEESSEAPDGPAEDNESHVDQQESEDIVLDLELEEPNEVVEEAEKKDEEAKVDSDKALEESSEAPHDPAEDLESHVDQPESEDIVQDLEPGEVVEEAEKKDEEAKVDSDKALEGSSEAAHGRDEDIESRMDQPESEDSVQDLELEEPGEIVEEAEKKDEEAKVDSDKALEESSEAPHGLAEDLESHMDQQESEDIVQDMEQEEAAEVGCAETLEESSEALHGPAEDLESHMDQQDLVLEQFYKEIAAADKALEQSSEAPHDPAEDLESRMDHQESEDIVQDMEQGEIAEVGCAKTLEASGDVPASQPIPTKSLFGGGVPGLNFSDQSGNAAIEQQTRSYIKDNFPPLSLDQLVANGMSHQQSETSGYEGSGRSPEQNRNRPGTSGGYRQAANNGYRSSGGYSQTRPRPQIASLEHECEIITLDDSSDEAESSLNLNALKNVQPVIPIRNMPFPAPPFANQNPLISTTYNYENINEWAPRNQPPPPPTPGNRPHFFPRGKSLNRNDVGNQWDKNSARIPNSDEADAFSNLNALRNVEPVIPIRNMLFPTPQFSNQNPLISNTFNYQNINQWALRNQPLGNRPRFYPRGKSLNRNDVGNRWDQSSARIPVYLRGRSVAPEAGSLALAPRNVALDTRSLAGSYSGGFRRNRTPTPYARRNGGDNARSNGGSLARSASKSTRGRSRSKSRRSRRRRSSSEESSSSSDTSSYSHSSSRGRKRHRHKHHRKIDRKLMDTGFTERQIELIRKAFGEKMSKSRKRHKSHKRKKSRRHSRHHHYSSYSSESSPRRGNSARNRYKDRYGVPGTSGSSGRKRSSEEFGDYHRSGKRNCYYEKFY